MISIMTNATKRNSIPITDAMDSGAVENATIPSREYKNNFQKDHFVLPATRSTFLYSSHFVRKPTHPKIPFEKRLYSPISRIASVICLVISRKSLAPVSYTHLGIEMDENFKRPYFSISITDFWHRWHITLGTWMKDYLFYPLSLSKGMGKFGKFAKKTFGKTYGRALPICMANIVVFLVVGIWHGAAWKFIVYGLYNGIIIGFSGLMAKNYRCLLYTSRCV